MKIDPGNVFANKEGRTVKIDEVSGAGPRDKVYYYFDGGTVRSKDSIEQVNKMLEGGGYKEITHLFSGFFVPKISIGQNIYSDNGAYQAEIVKKDSTGVHVRFSDRRNHDSSTVYIYDEKDFDVRYIFTPELLSELGDKLNNINVFEVIGEDLKSNDLKFTIVGKSVDVEMLEKINKTYEGVRIYQIKRLTNINIK